MRTYKLISAASILTIALMSASARAQVVTSSGGEVTGITQKNVVDRLIVADSVEIAMAQLALERTKNAAVRELANVLVTDHRAHVDSIRKFAGKPDVGRASNPTDSSVVRDIRLLAQLKSMPADSTFDRAFVNAQVERHQQVIDGLTKWRTVVTNVELKQDIERIVPVLEQHLAKSKAVATQLPPSR